MTRLFVSQCRNDVAAVVLVEPSDEVVMVRAGTPYIPIAQFGFFSFLGRIGVVRLLGSQLIPAFAEPTPAAMDRLPLLYGARAMDTAAAELRASVAGARSVAAVTSPGARGEPPTHRGHRRGAATRRRASDSLRSRRQASPSSRVGSGIRCRSTVPSLSSPPSAECWRSRGSAD